MDEITLKNFRCFRDEQTVPLAPLTLLVGENSTGKTSFMAMVRALWDVVGSGTVPNFKDEPYDLGSFDEIAHYRGGRGGRAESFEAGFKIDRRTSSRPRGLTQAKRHPYEFKVTFKKRRTVPSIVRARLANGPVWMQEDLKDQSWRTKFGTNNGAWEFSASKRNRFSAEYDRTLPPLFYPIYRRGIREPEDQSNLVALSNSALPNNEDWTLIERLFDTYRSDAIRYFRNRPYAGAPVRSKPRRTYDPAPDTVDPEGKGVPMLLANLYFRRKSQWDEMKNALESFGKAAGLYDEISIRPLGKKDSEPFQMRIRKFGDKAKGPWRNLIDVGYGISQVLPVVTDLLRDRATPMFLLQQPEVHLHPSAQAALGSLFCNVASARRKLVIETHSDYLLDRVRMEIRDGNSKLKPKDVSILFFERGALEVQIHSINIDSEGNIINAPGSYRKFFMDETTRSLGL